MLAKERNFELLLIFPIR